VLSPSAHMSVLDNRGVTSVTPSTTVARFALETSGDRVVVAVWLSPQEQLRPDMPGELQVILARHGEVAVQWWASVSCRWEADHWVGEIQAPRAAVPRLAELTGVVDPAGQNVLLPPDTLLLEPATDGPWQGGPSTDSARQRLSAARDQIFDQPLMSPDATATSSAFTVLMAVDNLLSSIPQRIPGIRVIPIGNSTLGSDLIDVLNGCAAQVGFGTGIQPAAGLTVIRQRRPAAVLYAPKVLADTPATAIEEARRTALTLLDLITLRRGASPRLLAGMIGRESSPGSLRLVNFWVEGTGYGGNLVGGPISGEDPVSLLSQWRGITLDGRARLWLSLYSDALADERWDYRVFRCFNLLEGIASEVVTAHQPVTDGAGNALLQANGSPYTTDQARGKVFQLVKHVAQQSQITLSSFASAGASSPRTLWDETFLWVTIRNAVAHRGSWEQAPGAVMSPRDQQVQTEVSSLGSDGTIGRGISILLLTIKRTVEAVLFAAVNGRL
jgi:hypothetical protein